MNKRSSLSGGKDLGGPHGKFTRIVTRRRKAWLGRTRTMRYALGHSDTARLYVTNEKMRKNEQSRCRRDTRRRRRLTKSSQNKRDKDDIPRVELKRPVPAELLQSATNTMIILFVRKTPRRTAGYQHTTHQRVSAPQRSRRLPWYSQVPPGVFLPARILS